MNAGTKWSYAPPPRKHAALCDPVFSPAIAASSRWSSSSLLAGGRSRSPSKRMRSGITEKSSSMVSTPMVESISSRSAGVIEV